MIPNGRAIADWVKKSIRVFSLAEIKAGEDDAHMAIIPEYSLVRVFKEVYR